MSQLAVSPTPQLPASVSPCYPYLVSTQQTPACGQRLQLGIKASRHAAAGPVHSRGTRAAACTGRGCSPSKMPCIADSCCIAYGKGCESQPVDPRMAAAFWTTPRDKGRTWGTMGISGALPQDNKAQLAGSTSRALGRLAQSLRYCQWTDPYDVSAVVSTCESCDLARTTTDTSCTHSLAAHHCLQDSG